MIAVTRECDRLLRFRTQKDSRLSVDFKGGLCLALQTTPGSIVTWADMGDPAAETGLAWRFGVSRDSISNISALPWRLKSTLDDL